MSYYAEGEQTRRRGAADSVLERREVGSMDLRTINPMSEEWNRERRWEKSGGNRGRGLEERWIQSQSICIVHSTQGESGSLQT